jgi:2-phospho-L-lactate guanylyltransferase
MTWRAIVPLNYGGPCKTRLATALSEGERNTLVIAMASHVVATLASTPEIAEILVISPEKPPLDGTQWVADEGRGLNAELAAARAGMDECPVLFIHADLPEVSADDIAVLLAAAEATGAAIGPDEAGQGTNAIAIADGRNFTPAFGADSLAAHRRAMPDAVLVERHGLGHDIDEPDSLQRALAKGSIAPPI